MDVRVDESLMYLFVLLVYMALFKLKWMSEWMFHLYFVVRVC